jgi:hypothetical protein
MESIFSGRKISESSKLDGINYTLWSFKLGTILRGERVWQVVDLDILPQALGASGSRSLNAHAIPSDSRESSRRSSSSSRQHKGHNNTINHIRR